MKFRHKIEKVNLNGVKEYSQNYFVCDELLVGRGSACHLRLDSRSVAVEHFKLFLDEEQQLQLEVISPAAELKVNGKALKQAKLAVGDKLGLGEIVLTVFFDGTYWGFHEARLEKKEEDLSSVASAQAKLLDLSKFYPSFPLLCALAFLLVFSLAFCLPMTGRGLSFWSSGPVSNPHKMFEGDCRTCHSVSFKKVEDKQCSNCHALTEHSLKEISQKHNCVDCHSEHQGLKKPIEWDSRLCVSCHASPEKLLSQPEVLAVSSFTQHPEFSVDIPVYADLLQSGVAEKRKKVYLSDLPQLKDSNRLKFNHELHLKPGLKAPKGERDLECSSCHRFSADLKKILPITYEAQCAECHALGFDDRLSEKVVPHGEADMVYNFIFAEYAKLFLNTEKAQSRETFVRRFKPGREVEAANPGIDFTKQFVEQEARRAESELFTKTACYLCHQVAEVQAEAKAPELKPAASGRSAYRVLKPYIPEQWMPGAIFEHGTHQELSCDSCHHGVNNSKTVSDVLLPRIADCRTCHADPGAKGKVNSSCISCHSYHDPKILGGK